MMIPEIEEKRVRRLSREENVALNREELKARKSALASSPRLVTLGTHYACNAKCVFCVESDFPRFDLERYKSFFEGKMGHFIHQAEKVTFTGFGEVLLLPEAERMLDYLNEVIPDTWKIFTTNGTPLRAGIIERLLKSKYVIQVSLHASNARLHEELTGLKGAFPRIIDSVEALCRLRNERDLGESLHVALVDVLTRRNVADLPDLIRKAWDLKVPEVQCNYVTLYEASQIDLSCFFDQEGANRAIDAARHALKGIEGVADPDEFKHFDVRLPRRFLQAEQNPSADRVCADPWEHVYVECQGPVLPCCMWGEHIGNLEKGDGIDGLWNGPVYQELRSKMASGRPHEWCARCASYRGHNVDSLRCHLTNRPEQQKKLLSEISGRGLAGTAARPERPDSPTVLRLRRGGLERKLENYLLVEREMERGEIRVKGKPYWLTLDPTSFCQLKCPFCPTGQDRGVRPKASMPLERFEKILNVLGAALIHIDFMNWGEPLLNKDIYRMIAAAKSFHIDTMLSTNLNAFGEKEAEKMVRSGLDRVVLSIDGLSPETYAKYRAGGDYAKVIEHLRMLVRKRRELDSATPRIAWQFLVFKHNEHEVDFVKKTALELGADEVGITPAFLPFRPGIKDEWLPEKKEHRLYDPESFPDSPPWHWERSKPKLDAEKPPEVDVKVYNADKRDRSPCNWPWAGIAINSDGSVSPCCSVEEKEYDFGNFEGQSFEELWNNADYRRAREHVRRYARREADSIPNSSHACERCFSIGRSRFQLPHSWLEPGGGG